MANARWQAPWYHGWNVVAVCVASGMSGLALTMNCFSLFIPYWSREFDAPVSTIALAVTLFSFGAAGLSYVAGICADRYPARRLFGPALLALGICHLLIAVSGASWQFLLVYALLLPFAISFSASVPGQSLVSRWFVRRVGLAMGITASGLTAAGIVFPPLIVLLLPLVGWRGVWAGFGGVILLAILPVAMIVLRDRAPRDDSFGYVTGETQVQADAGASLGDIVRRRNFCVIVAVFVAVQCVAMTMYIDIAPIVDSYGGAPATAGLFLALLSASALVSQMIAGWLADRIGNRLPLAIVAFATGCGALLLAIADASPLYLGGVALISGMSGAIWTLLGSAMLAEFDRASFGRAFGLACAFSPIATFAPPIVARLHEVTGSYQAPLGALGVTSLAAGLVVLALYRPRAIANQPR